MSQSKVNSSIVIAGALLVSLNAQAANWSDTSIGIRHGERFAEPGAGPRITKSMFNFTHVGGDSYGGNYFTVDTIVSDSQDHAVEGTDGAQEIYGFYQRTVPFSVLGVNARTYDYLSQISVLARVDLGSKNTAFGSRPRKYRLGFEIPVPITTGFWSFSVAGYKETNYNGFTGQAVSFDPTWSVGSAWSIPLGPGSFGGFVSATGAKGKDGFGNETKTELMARVTYLVDIAGSGFNVGVGYQAWRNMFGNDESLDSTGGSRESAPMLMTEYHF
ncbi:hypothetical protein [Marinobacter sp. X15-166B]|uniref:hypothetical protein n=1 Tax=Marinobacter sp. X15-166B TaxID=1897620 RepID=UPI00085C3A53|nr:hypothetical protein [Marinobacter sp. X15-166B]OEY65937.1 hypothetical protein BG841_05355 [Marinobacter sp. X15-166B]